MHFLNFKEDKEGSELKTSNEKICSVTRLWVVEKQSVARYKSIS